MLTLSLRPLWLRLAFLLAFAAALTALGFFLTRTAMGDSLATFALRSADIDTAARLESADLAISYAARDPLVHFRRGNVYLAAASEDQSEARLATAVAEAREATRLGQEDTRNWILLGLALDRSQAKAEARAAMERAVQLAPQHFRPRWVLGNYLLRAGEREAAFAQFRVALANHPSELPLIFDYAWNAYHGDGRAIINALALSRKAQAELVSLFIARDRVEDALSIWREIDKPGADEVRRVAYALIGKRRFAAAYEIWRASAPNELPSPEAGSLLANGGFESEITFNATLPFLTWQIKPQTGVTISRDSRDHRAGAYSLRVGIDLPGNPELMIAAQTVVVAPATVYRLSFAAQTEELRNLSPPLVEVYDAAHQQRLHVTSKRISTEQKQWQEQTVEFTTSPATEAITVRIVRPPCGDPPCPLKGHIWLDDFKLSPRTK